MSMKWIAIGLSLCAAAQVALLIWGRHIRGDVLSGLRIGVAIAMVGFGFALAFHTHERSQSGSSIQVRLDDLKVRQANLKTRFNALLAYGTARLEPLRRRRISIGIWTLDAHQ